MEFTDDPYEYGDATTDGGLGGDDTPEGCENGGDAVIVDGTAVSYRSYKGRDGG
ncbi:hypothetical protein [Halosegnis marinus]|uniref:Uncharacterized protein n=1 Tax=Halosegnis marinus TaxID=3034023 RepID=A0ABD5ZKB7_9EURY|nr:hypothetical protein [Halosegnis sp. DT85]